MYILSCEITAQYTKDLNFDFRGIPFEIAEITGSVRFKFYPGLVRNDPQTPKAPKLFDETNTHFGQNISTAMGFNKKSIVVSFTGFSASV